MLVEHRPTTALASFVETFWYCEDYRTPHRSERVLPNGKFQLIIDLSGGFVSPLVVGMQSRYSVIHTAALQSVMGVLFRPGGARAFFNVSAEEFHNRQVQLDLLWGHAAGELRDRLSEAPTPARKFAILEAALQKSAEARLELHGAVRYSLAELQRMPHLRSVLSLARDAGLSRRRFAQLFREQVGVTPKLYCRLLRFQEVVRQINSGKSVDWADVALAGGYCDQAHLAHEFRNFSGLSPSAFLAGNRPFLNHVAVD